MAAALREVRIDMKHISSETASTVSMPLPSLFRWTVRCSSVQAVVGLINLPPDPAVANHRHRTG